MPDAEARMWALTFEHSPVGTALLDTAGRCLRVNRSLCRMLGYPAEQLTSLTWRDLTLDDPAPDLDLVDQCLAAGPSGCRQVRRCRHADGRTVWGDVSVALVRDEAGVPLHVVLQVVDVTAHHADRDRLDRALLALGDTNADLEQYAAVVSHDLKTPLSGVKAWLELLVEQLAGGRPRDGMAHARALVSRADATTDHMVALIDAFLAHATADPRDRVAGAGRDGRVPTRLLDVVTSALSDVQLMSDHAGATVVVDPGVTDAPAVLVSAPLARTLVVNLVSNAVKHRDPSRALRVGIDAGADPDSVDRLLVTVGNDGPAIPPADRERVFGLFSRGGGHADRDHAPVDGFGIGLAACHRIVSWHGGRIWIEEPDGGGVAVRFTLPLAGPGHLGSTS